MSIQDSVLDFLHIIVSLYTSKIIEWLIVLIEPFPDINRFAHSTSHGEENETKLQTLSTPP